MNETLKQIYDINYRDALRAIEAARQTNDPELLERAERDAETWRAKLEEQEATT